MELTEENLSLTTTDLELTTRVVLPVTGSPGQAVVPARLLSEVVRSIAGETVDLVREDGSLRVTGGKAKFSLRSLPAEDFPRIQSSEDGRELKVDAEAFRKALGQVAIAASRDETRPVLTGVLFEGDGDELKLVATDSYRLALRSIGASGAEGVRLLVPARAVQEVSRMAAPEPIRVLVSSSQIAFEAGPVVIRSRLIEGDFPEYRKILPTNLPNLLEADRASLLESLRRVAIVAQDATPMFIEFDGDEIHMRCQSQGLGEAAEDLVNAEFKGDPMRVAFNPAYLQQGVEAVEDERVRLELNDAQNPAIVRGVSDDRFVYLIMPVRVS
jgi:DNA polymerase-3 subunit beta